MPDLLPLCCRILVHLHSRFYPRFMSRILCAFYLCKFRQNQKYTFSKTNIVIDNVHFSVSYIFLYFLQIYTIPLSIKHHQNRFWCVNAVKLCRNRGIVQKWGRHLSTSDFVQNHFSTPINIHIYRFAEKCYFVFCGFLHIPYAEKSPRFFTVRILSFCP